MNSILEIKVKNKIFKDIKKIEELIEAQLKVSKYKQCPLYQDVIDTQIFGVSKELELAVELNFISESYSREILENLEDKLNNMYSRLDKRKIN